MSNIDPRFMTFYFNDGTKETVEAHSYNMGLGKLKKEDPMSHHPFWQMGKGEGIHEMAWDGKAWTLVMPMKVNTPDGVNEVTQLYQPFEADWAHSFDRNTRFHTVEAIVLDDDIVMKTPDESVFITKEQVMAFFGLIDPDDLDPKDNL